MTRIDYDVVIVGGGLVGISLGLGLTQQGLSTAIIELDSPEIKMLSKRDSRCVALSTGSADTLAELNLWSDFNLQASPVEKIHVSERRRFGVTWITAKEMSVDALGYILSFAHMTDVLYQKLQQSEIDLFARAQVNHIEFCQDHAALSVDYLDDQEQPSTLKAKLVIAADGAHSRLRALLGSQQVDEVLPTIKKYRQTAIVASLDHASCHEQTAYERFTSLGPLAMLPLGKKRSAMIWSVHDAQYEDLMALSDKDFLSKVQKIFGYRLGKFTKISSRSSFPLKLVLMSQQIYRRCLFMGNAAHSLHPIAAQGFNLSLRDVREFLKTVAKFSQQGKAIDDPIILEYYGLSRLSDQKKTVRFTDSLMHLFNTDFYPLSLLRGLGLFAFEQLPFLKRKLFAIGKN